jgi:hypothetical protein
MKKTLWYSDRCLPWRIVLLGIIAFTVLLCGIYSPVNAKDIKQKSFASPEEAVKALVEAVRTNDRNELLAIFGPEGKEVISSGDEVEDRTVRERFLKKYEEMNKLETRASDEALLHMGADDWIFPIPVAKKDNTWFFDTGEGKAEILNRRIGRNELRVIEALQEYGNAQREYASKDRDGDGVLEFAQKFGSTKGKKDGLYWEVKEGEEESPFGPLAASAAKEGYTKKKSGTDAPRPFHGYYYRVLTKQGRHAIGKNFDYIVNGNMILGFAAIAYPAQYGNSGIMSFIVNQEGVVYQKDLGKNTEKIAKAVKMYDPDKTWKKVE